MIDLSQIFPTDYPERPSQKDIEIMFQDILNHSDSVDSIVCAIDDEPCPFYKEALTHCIEDNIDAWYQRRHPIAGVEYGNAWIPYWQDPHAKLRQLINKYQNHQLHYTYTPVPIELTTTPIPAASDGLVPADIPAGKSLQSMLKSAIQQVAQELSSIQLPAAQPIIIQNMPITIHYHQYHGAVGQVADTITEQINNQL
jgi:hypothetical protein